MFSFIVKEIDSKINELADAAEEKFQAKYGMSTSEFLKKNQTYVTTVAEKAAAGVGFGGVISAAGVAQLAMYPVYMGYCAVAPLIRIGAGAAIIPTSVVYGHYEGKKAQAMEKAHNAKVEKEHGIHSDDLQEVANLEDYEKRAKGFDNFIKSL